MCDDISWVDFAILAAATMFSQCNLRFEQQKVYYQGPDLVCVKDPYSPPSPIPTKKNSISNIV